MNNAILNIEIQEFIQKNLNSDISTLLLKTSPFQDVSSKALVAQIESKKKCQKKLPTWFKTRGIYYPNKLNIEQTSSEIAAAYKASLISGDSIIDITGGLGVDAYYFSKQFKSVTHCEINESLSKIASHNFKQLNTNHILTVNYDGLNYLQDCNQNFDWIYIDPSRRHDSKGKVFYLKDCIPNITEHLDLLFTFTSNILVKTSPMLDISIGISELKHVKHIHIIAINNEVKELLFHLEKNYVAPIEIKTVNITKNNNQTFDFKLDELQNAKASYSKVNNYLYEPNTALLKSGAFQLISEHYAIDKLHQHTHLYTSETLINFPGRQFKVLDVFPYNKKAISKAIGNTQVNLSTRNFPESVSQLKKKFKFKDGGDTYVFFTSQDDHKKVVIICEAVVKT